MDEPIEQRIRKAMSHPVRVRLLEILRREGEAAPSDVHAEVGIPLNLAAYHLKTLHALGLLDVRFEGRGRRRIRTALYSIARSLHEAMEWQAVPETVRDEAAAQVARAVSHLVGRAVDADARRVLGAYTVLVDEQGIDEAAVRAFVDAVRAIEVRSAERAADGRDPFSLAVMV